METSEIWPVKKSFVGSSRLKVALGLFPEASLTSLELLHNGRNMGLASTQKKTNIVIRECRPHPERPLLRRSCLVHFNKIQIYLLLLETTFQDRHTLASSSYWGFGIGLYGF